MRCEICSSRAVPCLASNLAICSVARSSWKLSSGWPGIGRLLVDTITKRDYPLVQAAILFITSNFVLIDLIVDLSCIYLDPRIRLR